MTRSVRFAIALCAIALLLLSATDLRAEECAVAGNFRYVGGAKELSGLEQAIDQVVRRMNFFIRGIARRRLREPNVPSEMLAIKVGAGQITIERPGRPTVSAPSDGKVVPWVSPSRDKFAVRHQLSGNVVEQYFRTGSGESVNRFALSEDSRRLVVTTTITDSHLPIPLTFSTTYERM